MIVASIVAFAVMWQRNVGEIAEELGPGWVAIVASALVFNLWLLAQVPWSAALPTLGILAAGGFAYLLARRSGADVEAIRVRQV